MRGSMRRFWESIMSIYFNSRLYMRGSRENDVDLTGVHIFQFTPLHERQQRSSHWFYHDASNFNSRLYMRGSCNSVTFFPPGEYFNSRLYMRGSKSVQHDADSGKIFQFTPLHERQQLNIWISSVCNNFNSRLYMRGSGPSFPVLVTDNISIHAST